MKKKVPHYTRIIDARKRKISVGVPKEYFFDYLQPEVGKVFHNFIDIIKSTEIASVSDVSVTGSDKIYESWRP